MADAKMIADVEQLQRLYAKLLVQQVGHMEALGKLIEATIGLNHRFEQHHAAVDANAKLVDLLLARLKSQTDDDSGEEWKQNG
jgi:hypothetical protein